MLLSYYVTFNDVKSVIYSRDAVVWEYEKGKLAAIGLTPKNMMLVVEYSISNNPKFDIQINAVYYASEKEIQSQFCR